VHDNPVRFFTQASYYAKHLKYNAAMESFYLAKSASLLIFSTFYFWIGPLARDKLCLGHGAIE
jgi:hypothetical protein